MCTELLLFYKDFFTKLYSPMARSLTDYFLNPIHFIIDFSLGNDFLNKGERNTAYFVINLILSIIISICGCIYNEFLILFFCGLEHETYDQVSKRASLPIDLPEIFDDLDTESD